MTKGVLFLWVVCCFSSRRRNKQALFPSSAVWVNQKARRTGSGPFPSPQVQPAPDAMLGINLSHKEQSSHPPLPEVGKEEVFRDESYDWNLAGGKAQRSSTSCWGWTSRAAQHQISPSWLAPGTRVLPGSWAARRPLFSILECWLITANDNLSAFQFAFQAFEISFQIPLSAGDSAGSSVLHRAPVLLPLGNS